MDPSEWGPVFIIDPSEWGPMMSPYDKQQSQLDLLNWALEILLLKYPKLRASEWCFKLTGSTHEWGIWECG